jgi:hypothetical protein
MDFVRGEQPGHGVFERAFAYLLPVRPLFLREHFGRKEVRVLLIA